MGRPHKCPYCQATETVSKGVRRTKTQGDHRIRLCKACGRKFTPRNQRTSDAAEAKPATSTTPQPVTAAEPQAAPPASIPTPAVPADSTGPT